jgi:hypothetical protein
MRAPRRCAITATATVRDVTTRATPANIFNLPRRTLLASAALRAGVWGLFMCLPSSQGGGQDGRKGMTN